MPITDVDIYNQAISLLRGEPISAFNDGSNEAEIGTTHYEPTIQSLLTRYPWSFCTKKVALSATTAPLNEYRYAHSLPAGCLHVWALFPSASVGAAPITDYDIQAPANARVVFSNYENLWLDYTYQLDEQYWPAYFTELAVAAIAAKVAFPLTNQADLVEYWKKEAFGNSNDNGNGGLFAVMTRLDAMQKPAERIIDSPIISSRFS